MATSATNGSNGAANGIAKVTFDSFSNIVNGKLVSTSKTRHGINPATKKANPPVPVATPEDLDAAVEAGKAAYKKWSRVPIEERRKAILAFADALAAQKEDFAKMLTTEQGKPASYLLLHRRLFDADEILKFRPYLHRMRSILDSPGCQKLQSWICQKTLSRKPMRRRSSTDIRRWVWSVRLCLGTSQFNLVSHNSSFAD